MSRLREISARQIDGEPPRRWFHSLDIELTVWTDEAGLMTGFQLCYDKSSDERAITWTRENGYLHTAVDDGEKEPLRYKASPVLVVGGEFDRDRVLAAFLAVRGDVPAGFVDEIASRLQAYDAPVPGPRVPQAARTAHGAKRPRS